MKALNYLKDDWEVVLPTGAGRKKRGKLNSAALCCAAEFPRSFSPGTIRRRAGSDADVHKRSEGFEERDQVLFFFVRELEFELGFVVMDHVPRRRGDAVVEV